MNKKLKLRNKKVKSSAIEQAVTQDDSHSSAQLPLPSQQKKCLISVTFSQKLYQSHPIEIAEEYEQAIDDNSLEKINILFDKVLELGEGRVIG